MSMRDVLALASAVLFGASVAVGEAAAGEAATGPSDAAAVGRVVAITGKATASAGDQERPLALKSPVFLNDKIVTGEGAKLQIMFNDESVISQGERSTLTIDTYVYDPSDKKKSGCSFGLLRGLFHLVTAKIAELNPERFKVKTQMSTIGIRGCELAFNVGGAKEHVYVIHLHRRERVVVEPGPGWKGPQPLQGEPGVEPVRSAPPPVDVSRPGTAVTVAPADGLKERAFAAGELADLMKAVLPEAPPSGPVLELSSRPSPDAGATATAPAPSSSTTPSSGGTPSSEPVPTAATETAMTDGDTLLALSELPLVGASGTDGTLAGDLPAFDTGLLVLDSASLRPQPPPLDPAQIVVTEPPPEDTSSTGGTTPPPPSPVFTAMGGGIDWNWGVWEIGGLLDRVEFRSPRVISATDYDAISRGATLYSLTGTGDAAAALDDGASRTLVRGTCNLNVLVGLGTAPTWDGQFRMQNAAGDQLNFDAGGSIQTGNQRAGNQTTYLLRLHGTTFLRGSLTSESINGSLVGPGSGSVPISGAIGDFHFVHGTAVRADGGYGTDLK